jgi:arylsulfatase A-like enzyme
MRRLLIVLLLLAALGCGAQDSRPNVIVIMVDTLRADYLGAYGFEGEISPNIDALAAESVQFDNCIAQAPWTSPSVASFVTSLHPQNHCVANGYGLFCEVIEDDEYAWETLPDEATTLAEVFRDSGYETAGFVGNWVVKSKFGFAQGFDTYVEPQGDEQHIDEDRFLFEQATEWLRQRRSGRPFLLYLHLMDVHAPYRLDSEGITTVRGSPSLGKDRALTEQEIADRPSHLGARIRWPDPAMADRLRNWKVAYGAGVHGFDRQLGEFLGFLREERVLDDAVVVFASDHGEEFLEHGAWEHGKTYFNPALQVPLLLRLPGAERAGQRVGRLVSLIDVMPTLMRLAGIDQALAPMQGQDLGPRVSGESDPEEPWAFASALPEETATIVAQNEQLKLILDLETGSVELYDLVEDPGEQRNIASERDDLLDLMQQRVQVHLESLRSFPSFRPTSTALSDEDIEKLRSLGYVR